MDASNRKVVVISPVTTFLDSDWELHVARFRELGLTSYGKTEDAALRRLKKNFREFIHVLRKNGVLEETLDKLNVRWYWADEYPVDGPEYEDTNALVPVVMDSKAAAAMLGEQDVYGAANNDLAMAA